MAHFESLTLKHFNFCDSCLSLEILLSFGVHSSLLIPLPNQSLSTFFLAPYLFLFLRFYFLMLLLFIYQKNIYKVFTMCIIVWKFLRDSKVHMTKALFRRLWLLLVKRDVSQSFQLDNTSASPPLSTFFLSKLTDPQDFIRSTSWPTLALLIYSWISSSLLDLSLWIYYRHLNFNVSHIKFSLYQCSFHLPKDHCLSTGFLVLNVAICSNTRPVS